MDELETSEASFAVEESSDASGDPVLRLSGELDISSAEALRQVVETVVDRHPPRLVFDLAELSFMDSSGIAVLVFAANKIDDVQLLHPSTIIQRVVAATGLSEILRLDPQ